MLLEETNNRYTKWPGDEVDLIKVMKWSGDKPIDTHKHDFIEIAFLAQGACIHYYNGSELRLIPGDLFIITPHEEHSYKITQGTTIYNCLFYPEALGEDWSRLKNVKSIYELLIIEPFFRMESGSQEILHLPPSESEYIEETLIKMLKEQESKQVDFELVQKSNLLLLLCNLGRAWEHQFKEKGRLYSGKRDMLVKAICYIEENLQDEFTIGKLASIAYLSPNYFSRIFKEETGLTPIEYINRIRVSKACQLFTTKDITVSEVAEAVGINDLNYFSRLFKAIAGNTPSQFKKKCGLC